jgi:hypothetical protein
MFYRSSWSLFISDPKQQPLEPKEDPDSMEMFDVYTSFSFSGNSYSLGPDSKTHFDSLRRWGRQYLSKEIEIDLKNSFYEDVVSNTQ